ncbi:MAG: hypothetical protein WC686_05690 [Candidatus Shapirobacteria bacterium]|jgi:hypothetical protein
MYHSKNIAIFIDDQQYFNHCKYMFEASGYHIVGVASSLEQANHLLTRLDQYQIGAAIIDGCLSKNKSDCKEGSSIANKVKKINRSIITIGFDTVNDVPGADYQSPKIDGTSKLINLLDEILN